MPLKKLYKKDKWLMASFRYCVMSNFMIYTW